MGTVPCRSFCKLSGRSAIYHRLIWPLPTAAPHCNLSITAPLASTSASRNPIAEAIATGLGRLLADTYTLYLKTHNFHWNVTGPMFQTLHVMFEQQYTELAASCRSDRRADSRTRISRAGHVQGVPRHYVDQGAGGCAERRGHDSRSSSTGRRPSCGPRDRYWRRLRRSTINRRSTLLTQRLQTHEKAAWMLRSLLQT